MSSNASENPVSTPRFEQLSASPSIWVCHEFLTDEQCGHLIQLAKDRLRPSLVVDPSTGDFKQIESRTSSLTFLDLRQDEVVAEIEERISALLKLPVENGEGLQILQYKIGEEYKPHYDWFNIENPGSAKALNRGGQRVVTMLMYLTDVEEGGETIFPKIDLKFAPKKREALIFYNLFSNGEPDPNTLHGSAPVIRGEKWVATKWLRERTYIDKKTMPSQNA